MICGNLRQGPLCWPPAASALARARYRSETVTAALTEYSEFTVSLPYLCWNSATTPRTDSAVDTSGTACLATFAGHQHARIITDADHLVAAGAARLPGD